MYFEAPECGFFEEVDFCGFLGCMKGCVPQNPCFSYQQTIQKVNITNQF